MISIKTQVGPKTVALELQNYRNSRFVFRHVINWQYNEGLLYARNICTAQCNETMNGEYQLTRRHVNFSGTSLTLNL
jgi:hypothetical protein